MSSITGNYTSNNYTVEGVPEVTDSKAVDKGVKKHKRVKDLKESSKKRQRQRKIFRLQKKGQRSKQSRSIERLLMYTQGLLHDQSSTYMDTIIKTLTEKKEAKVFILFELSKMDGYIEPESLDKIKKFLDSNKLEETKINGEVINLLANYENDVSSILLYSKIIREYSFDKKTLIELQNRQKKREYESQNKKTSLKVNSPVFMND